jgi:hypothetical protein
MRTDARASVDLAWAQPKRDRDHHRPRLGAAELD